MKELIEIVKKLKEEYPKGTRVELLKMNDPYRHIPIGTQGTVLSVDDMATVHVNWDCGSSLGVIYKEDKIKIVGN